jgi:hypothetical protein
MGDIRPGDWMCTACGNHNFASRTACNRCKAPRPPETFTAAAGQQQQAWGQHAPAAGSWQPPAGSYSNNNPAPTAAAPQQQAAGEGGEAPVATPGGDNAAFLLSFLPQMRPAAMQWGGGWGPGGGWGAQQQQWGGGWGGSNNQAMRPGDWMCPACGNHNFASRTRCNRCGADKEGKALPEEGGKSAEEEQADLWAKENEEYLKKRKREEEAPEEAPAEKKPAAEQGGEQGDAKGQGEAEAQPEAYPAVEVTAQAKEATTKAQFWYYVDGQGTLQGPFYPGQMKDWFVQKLLPPTLKVGMSLSGEVPTAFHTIEALFEEPLPETSFVAGPGIANMPPKVPR